MPTLYTVTTSNGQRASIALEECGITYSVRTVDLLNAEHRSEAMLALNPFGRMPVLQHDDGNSIYGSLAIGMHAANSSGLLLPRETERDQFYHWLGILLTDLAPAFSAQFYLGILAPQPDEWANALYADIIERFLTGIDQHLAEHEYFLDGGYSLVDVMMYPTATTSMSRMPGGVSKYPNIERWSGLSGAREAVLQGMAISS
ncbi:MAG: glutathione S-transferase family protein [Gammaproteobacteria bacterium]|nr:glutathione S-transferase family protein [Gammaproteobacteria bacterium]